MPEDAQERHAVHTELADKLSARTAAFLMEHLPPVPWDQLVTKNDLARLEEKLDLRIESFEHKLTAVFRGELNASITSQTRSIIVGQVGAVVATAIAVIATAQLA